MNDSTECTCDIRLGGCTCGAMERERRANLGAEMAKGEVVCHGCERTTTFAECEVVGMRLLCACCRQAKLPTGEEIDAGNRIAGMRQAAEERLVFAVLNAAAVNANVSPDVVRERDLLLHTPPEPIALVTKQQAAEMHAELVARIEALEAAHVSRWCLVNETGRRIDYTAHVAHGSLTITVRDANPSR